MLFKSPHFVKPLKKWSILKTPPHKCHGTVCMHIVQTRDSSHILTRNDLICLNIYLVGYLAYFIPFDKDILFLPVQGYLFYQ